MHLWETIPFCLRTARKSTQKYAKKGVVSDEEDTYCSYSYTLATNILLGSELWSFKMVHGLSLYDLLWFLLINAFLPHWSMRNVVSLCPPVMGMQAFYVEVLPASSEATQMMLACHLLLLMGCEMARNVQFVVDIYWKKWLLPQQCVLNTIIKMSHSH